MNNTAHDDLNQKGGAVAWPAIALAVLLIGAAIIFLATTGCAHDNGIIYKPAPKPKSTVAENTEAIGNQVARLLGVLKPTEK